MDKIRHTAFADDRARCPEAPSSQGADAAQERQQEEATGTSNIEERFANWGSD